jgi:hypothetical protein
MFTLIAPDRLFSSNWLAAMDSTFPVNHQEPQKSPNNFPLLIKLPQEPSP